MKHKTQSVSHLLNTVVILFLSFSTVSIHAQGLMLLQGLEYDHIATASGLGQSFFGKKMDNGELFFLATFRLHPRSLWKTNGTPARTEELITPTGYFDWQAVYFLDNHILFDKNDDHLYVYDINSQLETDLGDIGEVRFSTPIRVDEDEFILLADNNDLTELWRTDLTVAGTNEIVDMGPYLSSFKLSASTKGAVLYRTNNSDYEPQLYNFSTNTLSDILTLVSPLLDITEVEDAYIYDKYIFINGRNNFQFESFIYDIELNTVHDAPSLREVDELIEYNGVVYIKNGPQIHRFDPSTVTLNRVVFGVAGLSTVLQDDNLLYHVHDPNDFVNYPIHVLDMDVDTTYELPTTNIGRTNYDNEMALYGNSLYYSKREFPHTFLYKYDFQTSSASLIDTIANNNGAITIRNVIEQVGDHLVVSVYDTTQAHELFYLEDNSGILLPFSNNHEVLVFPNPTERYIELKGVNADYGLTYIIYDIAGKAVLKAENDINKLDVSNLIAGQYFGVMSQNDEVWRFSFVKQ